MKTPKNKKVVLLTNYYAEEFDPELTYGTVVNVNGTTKDAVSLINGIRMDGYCVQYNNLSFIVPENAVVDYEIWKTPLGQLIFN